MIAWTDISPFFDSEFNINLNHVNNLPSTPQLYINGASEHYGDGILEDLARLVPNHTVLSHYENDYCQFYPYWYYWAKSNWPTTFKTNISGDRKTYQMSCLNNSSHSHRIINWFKIRKLNNCLVSMRNDPINNSNNISLTEQEHQLWNLERQELKPRQKNSKEGARVDADILHEAYTDSYVNLVTETTTCDKVFMSEKTWKPIASGQLFLILGNPGIIKHLRDQGIDCFDDIIDHSYDGIADTRERISAMQLSLHKLLTQDLFTLNILTKQRRTKNAELFWSDKLYEL